MSRLLMDDLKISAERFPDKTAVTDKTRTATYKELFGESYALAYGIVRKGIFKAPVGVYLEKSVSCIVAMEGIAASGNFFTILDTHMPAARITTILNTLSPALLVTDRKHQEKAAEFFPKEQTIIIDDIQPVQYCIQEVSELRTKIKDTDICYVLFTSGSTGTPKGVVISHRAVSAYLDMCSDVLELDEDTIFGNQAPFYFILSGFDIFNTLRIGGTMHIIPEYLFGFPVALLKYIEDHAINSLYWVPSAFCLVANSGALKEKVFPNIRFLMFGGEVMPIRQLNMWRKVCPEAVFWNNYGPTELTELTTLYKVDRDFKDTETLPIGRECPHMEVLILDGDHQVEEGEIGELCARGPCLAEGYYNDPERTAAVFVQNPLQNAYPERIYRTGDLVKRNERGELLFCGRKDFQIKHMGHRIELGEIEAAGSSIDNIGQCCALYQMEKKEIHFLYDGQTDQNEVRLQLKLLLPQYMLPQVIHQLDAMPHNLNGKIDRAALNRKIASE